MISLKESLDRRAYIAKSLKELGLNFQFFEAVDGTCLAEAEFEDIYNPGKAFEYTGTHLTLGQIGTSLSHARLYQKMVEEDIEQAIILEDDAKLTPDFKQILSRRDDFPPDWELILFYHGWAYYSFWSRRRIYKQYRMVKFTGYVDGAVGYLLKKSAAHKLLATGYPICMPADYLTGGWIKNGVKLYGIQPVCITHLCDAPRSSTRSYEMPPASIGAGLKEGAPNNQWTARRFHPLRKKIYSLYFNTLFRVFGE